MQYNAALHAYNDTTFHAKYNINCENCVNSRYFFRSGIGAVGGAPEHVPPCKNGGGTRPPHPSKNKRPKLETTKGKEKNLSKNASREVRKSKIFLPYGPG